MFTRLDVRPDIERSPWSDLGQDIPDGRIERVGLLRNGTSGGRAVVAIVITLPDGRRVLGQTTWRLFNSAARALAASPIAAEED
jgi:hypothetical protein